MHARFQFILPGVWIGKPFASRGYSLTADKELIGGIIKLLVNSFYEMLDDVTSKTSNVIVVVEAGGKLYSANKEVKVTVGGCGG